MGALWLRIGRCARMLVDLLRRADRFEQRIRDLEQQLREVRSHG